MIFFDGTGNTQLSRTNVSRLYELAENQKRNDLILYYTSGVGADRTGLVGQATGLGTGQDVRGAYRFLAENWNSPRDKVIVYGYSRGAWSARIFAGMLHTAGLIRFDSATDAALISSDRDTRRGEIERRKDIVRAIYGAYKGREFTNNTQLEGRIHQRRDWVQLVVNRRGLTIAPGGEADSFKIDVMGLFDTIEALGVPNGRDQTDFVNDRYSDQICNIRKVFHAMSLDDNRATTYTPMLMTRTPLVAPCQFGPKPDVNSVVEEVWFSGAHADVGGGYRNGYLPGVSLNWMLRKTKRSGVGGSYIFPVGAEVYENHHDIVHDAESFSLFFNVFNKQHRDLVTYLSEIVNPRNPNDPTTPLRLSTVSKIKIHSSVIHRLETYYRRVDSSARIDARGNEPQQLGARPKKDASDGVDNVPKKRRTYETLIPRPDKKGIVAVVKNEIDDPLQKLRNACFKETPQGGYRFLKSCPYIEVVE